MVRAKTYTDFLTRVGALMGSNSLSSVDEDLLNSFFNTYMRMAWEKAAWPNISPYGEKWTPDANGVIQFDMEEVLKTGLKAWWPLNDPSGTRKQSHNAITGTKDLTDNATVTRGDGLVDFAAQFTAANSEFLHRADEADLSTGDIDYVIHARVRADTLTADMMIVSKSNSPTVREYELFYDFSEERFRFEAFDSVGASIGAIDADDLGVPLINTWYDITAGHSKTDNKVFIYINGGAEDSTTTTGEPSDTAAIFKVGAKFDATEQDFWDGRIQDLGFWKKCFTEGEIERLWNNGEGNPYPWDLENYRIDRIFQIWSRDPTGTSFEQPLNKIDIPDGALILSTVPKTAYVHYRLRVPSYTGADWASGTTYDVEDQAYLTTNGRFYIATAKHSNKTPPDTVFWRELQIPHNFFEYAARMTFADLLTSETDVVRASQNRRIGEEMMKDAFRAMPPIDHFIVENHLTEQAR